ncbi:hypothetical protein Gotur_006198 [Gossypium turneri]
MSLKFVMENEFLDKVEDNAVVRIWSEKTQLERGDSLAKGYVRIMGLHQYQCDTEQPPRGERDMVSVER